ncbi:dihydrofolate reductase family protein [Actinoplanes bogorensis]|uniref:Dihydrofolate reductase family protein n=1 Tax=Paractinoplanes bogorensis TaxID=1610840 RepID=A0ABS5YTN4_9ACTN|nr:dihydrofolate reductase family protein [Actinoplanes bogorensis]MBU2666820.1 dihydrofolate reductase family protein [Actinoplanes bogorensis]
MGGRFVYWMNVSADLRIEHAAGEQGGGEWMRIGEPLHREFNRRARALSAMVQGRTIYETMEGFWPAARADESLPDFLREYGEIWTSKPKILVSRTRTSAGHNTTVAASIEELAELKSRTEGDIGVGGATVATGLLRAGLLDELLLFTHPVVLGAGRPLFDDQVAPVELDLLEHEAFDEGVLLHRYEVRYR